MEDILIGVTDRTTVVFIPDPASTDGSGKTGLTHADLTVSYTRVETDNDVTVTDVTSSLSTLSALTDAHSDWGVKEVSSTLAPGLYRVDIADAVFASGAWTAVVYVMITSSAAAATPKAFRLVSRNDLDGVRLGLTALPNAAADGAGGLPISDAGGLDLDAKIGALTYGTANRVNVQVYGMEANVMTAAAAAADLTTELQSGLATAAALATAQASIDDIPTNAELATALASADDAVLAAIAALNNLSQDNIRTAVGLASANLDTQIATLATAANLATVAGYIDTEIATIITNLATVASYIDTEIAALTTAVADVPTNAELATALAAADDAVLAAIAALNNLSSAQAQTAANDAMVALHLDHLLAADYNPASKPGVSTALLNELVESDGGVSRFTANALEQAPSGGGGGGGGEVTGFSDAALAELAGITIRITNAFRGVREPLEIVQGDDYDDDDGNGITFTIAGYADADISGATASLTLKKGDTSVTFEASSVTRPDDDIIILFEPTSAETAELTPASGARHGWQYDLQIELANGHKLTPIAEAPANVLASYTG